jgi:hypothetical protein
MIVSASLGRSELVDRGIGATEGPPRDKRPEVSACNRNHRDHLAARRNSDLLCGSVHAAAHLNERAGSVQRIELDFCGCGKIQVSYTPTKQRAGAPYPIQTGERHVGAKKLHLATQRELSAMLERGCPNDKALAVVLRDGNVGFAVSR